VNAARKEREPLPPAQILDCTPEEYKKDPCETPSLSASTAHKLISKSAMHAWSAHPKFGMLDEDDEEDDAEEEDSAAKDNGSIIHNLLLGKGADFEVIDFDSWRKKAAKEAKAEAKAAGKLPILTHRFDELQSAVEILRARLRTKGYEFNGVSEIPVQWYARGAQGPVLCRSMIDHGWLDQGISVDLKTIRNAHPEHIDRIFVEHGYHIQDHAYTRAHESLYPELTGHVDLTFLFVEIKPPYAITPYRPDGASQEIGKQQWERAVQVWETCLRTGVWPEYCSSRVDGQTPDWVIRKHLGKDWLT
jgi:hypothetical protein